MRAHRCPKCRRVITYAKLYGERRAFDIKVTHLGTRYTLRDGHAYHLLSGTDGRLLHVCPERGRG